MQLAMTETNTTNISTASEGTPSSQVDEKSLLPETEGKKLGVLSRVKRTMSNLALRLMARGEGGQANGDNGGADSENSDGAEKAEETLDDETLQRIEEIEEECDFYTDLLMGYRNSDIINAFIYCEYEKIEKFIPNIREVVASDSRLNPESEETDDRYYDLCYAETTLSRLIQDNIAAFFSEHYERMPKFTDRLRHTMRDMLDSIRSYFDNSYDTHELAVKLMNAERVLPKEIIEDLRDTIINEVARCMKVQWHDFNKCVDWLGSHGFPPEYWPRDAREQKDFPESLRSRILAGDEIEREFFDLEIIDYFVRSTADIHGGDESVLTNPDIVRRSYLIEEYLAGRWPDIAPKVFINGHEDEDSCSALINTIYQIGEANAKKLHEELGITHFGDWSPETLKGTLKLLETGCTESGKPATIIVRGVTGDHNGAASGYRNIKSADTFAVEINHTSDLSDVVAKLERVGVDSNTFDTVVLFGHGSEKHFFMSSYEKIPPNHREWYNKKGMRSLIETLEIDTIILNSCHPLVQEKRFETLTVGNKPQQRRGTAPALSQAFPQIQVISGLDGTVYSGIERTGNMQITTRDNTGGESSMTAVTKNGLTRAHREEVKIHE
ncbi:hypothetical protein FBF24_01360 [Candidatus Saccharibacteria bacterium oral taxon 488]|nr:hypothetical protein FBF24_01360 [Candidatus Saccharibacteria bacterium oral taxon 488]